MFSWFLWVFCLTLLLAWVSLNHERPSLGISFEKVLLNLWEFGECHYDLRDCCETKWRHFIFFKGDRLVFKICIDLCSTYYMFYQEHIGRHLFDIHLRKENGNVDTLLLLIFGRWLIFIYDHNGVYDGWAQNQSRLSAKILSLSFRVEGTEWLP